MSRYRSTKGICYAAPEPGSREGASTIDAPSFFVSIITRQVDWLLALEVVEGDDLALRALAQYERLAQRFFQAQVDSGNVEIAVPRVGINPRAQPAIGFS